MKHSSKNMIKTVALALAVCFLASFFSGCLDGKSVEDYGYVLAMGIDSGEKLTYNVTFLMQGSKSSEESSQLGDMILVSAEGPDMVTALETAELGAPYEFNFARMNLIAISRDVAEKGLLEDFFTFSIQEMQIRLSSSMIITTNKSEEFFQGLKYADELNYSKLVESLVGYRFSMGVTYATSLAQFLAAADGDRSDAVIALGSTDNSIISSDRSDEAEKQGEKPQPDEEDTTGGIERTGGMKSYVDGAALFQGYNMTGVLSAAEVQLLALAEGGLEGTTMAFSKPDGGFYTVRVENSSPTNVKINIDPTPTVEFHIHASGRLEEDTDIEKLLQERGSTDITKELEDEITAYMQNELNKLFVNCQKLNSDAFQLGRYASTEFRDTASWEEYEHKTHLSEYKASFDIDLDLEDIFIASYRD